MGIDTVKVPKIGYGLTGIFKVPVHKRDRIQTPMADWMDKESISQNDIAIACGVNHQSVNNWKYGKCAPSLVQAFLIERMSKGAVPVASWLSIPASIAVFQQLEMKRKSRQAGNYSHDSQTAGRIKR